MTPLNASQMHIPDTEQVCAWLMQQAGLKTVDLERARRLSQESDDTELLGLLTRLGLVSEVELARAWAGLLGAPLLLADAAPPLLDHGAADAVFQAFGGGLRLAQQGARFVQLGDRFELIECVFDG